MNTLRLVDIDLQGHAFKALTDPEQQKLIASIADIKKGKEENYQPDWELFLPALLFNLQNGNKQQKRTAEYFIEQMSSYAHFYDEYDKIAHDLCKYTIMPELRKILDTHECVRDAEGDEAAHYYYLDDLYQIFGYFFFEEEKDLRDFLANQEDHNDNYKDDEGKLMHLGRIYDIKFLIIMNDSIIADFKKFAYNYQELLRVFLDTIEVLGTSPWKVDPDEDEDDQDDEEEK